MKPKRWSGFTLVELLMALAIIALLAAIFMPVIISTKRAIDASGAARSLGQIQTLAQMYASDADDTYPPAIYVMPDGRWQTWFGTQEALGGWDRKTGILAPYFKTLMPADRAYKGEPYIGDGTGYGYNYGVIGGDFHVRNDFSGFPNCVNPARQTELGNPSNVITFPTSAYYNVPWNPNGDGLRYDFGFFDPPAFWHGNPNVDFRHLTAPVIDAQQHIVIHEGKAAVAFADGHVRTIGMKELTPGMFTRSGSESDR